MKYGLLARIGGCSTDLHAGSQLAGDREVTGTHQLREARRRTSGVIRGTVRPHEIGFAVGLARSSVLAPGRTCE